MCREEGRRGEEQFQQSMGDREESEELEEDLELELVGWCGDGVVLAWSFCGFGIDGKIRVGLGIGDFRVGDGI